MAGDMPWRLAPGGGLFVDVRLTPRGGRDAVDAIERRADGRTVLKARVRAPAFEGEANAALCRLVAGAAGAAPRQVTLVAGATARLKRLYIIGDARQLAAALTRSLDAAGKKAS
jgi:uncharacterized protein YggU (UPF0235/DUF167 family)